MTRFLIAGVMVFLGASCEQGSEDLLRGTWTDDDGTQIEFLDDNEFREHPLAERDIEGTYEWVGPSQIRMAKARARFGYPLETVTQTVVRVTPTDLVLRDEQGQVAALHRR